MKQIIYSYTPLKIQLGNWVKVIKKIPVGAKFVIRLTNDIKLTFVPQLKSKNRIEYILETINDKKVKMEK